MSSISSVDDTIIGTLDVSDLEGLDSTEITDKIIEAIQSNSSGLSPSEILAKVDEIKTQLADISDGIDNQNSEIEDDQDAAENKGDTDTGARDQLKLDKNSELQDLIDQINEAMTDVSDRLNVLYQESSTTDSPLYFYSCADLKNGDVATLRSTAGSSDGLFASDDSTEPTDTDLNGFITYDETVPTADALTAYTGMEGYLQIDPGYKILSITEDPNSTVQPALIFTMQLPEPEGGTAEISYQGDMNIYLKGSDYADPNVFAGLSDETLKRLYDNDNPSSIYYLQKEDSITEEERLSSISQYEDVMDQDQFATTFNSYVGNSTYNSPTVPLLTSDDAYSMYSELMTNCFSVIDGTNTDETSIATVFTDFFASSSFSTLSDADKAAFVQSVILALAQNGDETTFNTFLAPIVPTLESYLGANTAEDAPDNGYTVLDKMCALFLEAHAGVSTDMGAASTGMMGGSMTMWTSNTFLSMGDLDGDGKADAGSWTEHQANVDAINLLTSFTTNTGWAQPSGYETAIADSETALIETAEEESEEWKNDSMSRDGTEGAHGFDVTFDQGTEFKSTTSTWVGNYSYAFDGVWEDTLTNDINGFADMLTGMGTADIDDMRDKILNYFEDLTTDDGEKDDAALVCMVMLHNYAPELFWQLSRSESFRQTIWDMIDDGGAVPPAADELGKLWRSGEDYQDTTYYTI